MAYSAAAAQLGWLVYCTFSCGWAVTCGTAVKGVLCIAVAAQVELAGVLGNAVGQQKAYQTLRVHYVRLLAGLQCSNTEMHVVRWHHAHGLRVVAGMLMLHQELQMGNSRYGCILVCQQLVAHSVSMGVWHEDGGL